MNIEKNVVVPIWICGHVACRATFTHRRRLRFVASATAVRNAVGSAAGSPPAGAFAVPDSAAAIQRFCITCRKYGPAVQPGSLCWLSIRSQTFH
jgi:hypothetical protein